MGTEADTNLLRNPLPKEWHPASLHPSIPKYLKPTPGASPQLPGQPVSVGEGLRGTPAEGGCGDGGSGPPPQRVLAATRGCCSPTQGRGAQRSPWERRAEPPIVLLCSTPLLPTWGQGHSPTHTPTSGSLFPAWSWGWHLRGTHVPNRGHLAAQLQSQVGKTQRIKFSFCQLHPRVCQRGAGKDGYLFQGTNL